MTTNQIMSKRSILILFRILLVLFMIGIGWTLLQIQSLNREVLQANADKTPAAATMQAMRAELDAAQSQSNTRATLTANLQAQLAAAQSSANARVENLAFVSDVDATAQRYLLITPDASDTTPRILVVYLHSMGSGMDEILKWRTSEESLVDSLMRRKVILASPVYRDDSWLNPAATSDVTKMIRALKNRYPIDTIVVSGFSMGGTAAVMYPLVAPPDIGVNGIVAAAFASDVIDLWTEPGNAQVKDSLRIAYGGAPAQASQVYDERALLRNINRLPANIPVALFASYSDSMIPTSQQIRLRDALSKRGNPILFAQIPGDHHVDSLIEGFQFVLNRLALK